MQRVHYLQHTASAKHVEKGEASYPEVQLGGQTGGSSWGSLASKNMIAISEPALIISTGITVFFSSQPLTDPLDSLLPACQLGQE